jgi:DNA-directed RNA polymerase subunit RPC12/RpoP
MPEEAKFRCGALYCIQCKRRFYYRTHILPDSEENEVYKCPDCGHELQDVPVNTFLDNTEETLQVMNMLDEESREGSADEQAL